jgi:aryl-alcohol dehydrogenase-like predicted oxidoreductase
LDAAHACLIGVSCFQVYGAAADPSSWGYSEVLCGRFAREYKGSSPNEVLVATKFAPLPHRFLDGRKAVSKALRGSLERLGTDSADLYQLHWPGFFADADFWDGLADAYDSGLVRAVGVSNYSEKRLREVHKALAARGVPLATNQVQYSLLHRTPEKGVLQACDELGVKILAYSPLAQGCLTGR